MEKTKEFLELSQEDRIACRDSPSILTESIRNRGAIDRTGKLASGAIVNIVDIMGGAVVHVEGLPLKVSVDMSISFLSTAKLDDELELTSRVLGQKGGYSGTIVLIRNKTTGEVIAEGRHSLFGKHASKL